MFRFHRPAPRGAALFTAPAIALAAVLISACGTPGAPAPGVTPVPDGKPPAYPDGRPRDLLLVRSLRGPAAATEIAKAMDASDLKKAISVLELTRNDTPVWWRNEGTGREFLLTPRGSFGGERGPCRDFTVDVTTGKTTDRLQGTACQQVDTFWKLML